MGVVNCTCHLTRGQYSFFRKQVSKPVYQAKTTVLVNEAPTSSTLDISSVNLSEDLALTYSQMMTKSPVLNEVSKRLGLAVLDPTSISAIPETSTQLIAITVKSTNPKIADPDRKYSGTSV